MKSLFVPIEQQLLLTAFPMERRSGGELGVPPPNILPRDFPYLRAERNPH